MIYGKESIERRGYRGWDGMFEKGDLHYCTCVSAQ